MIKLDNFLILKVARLTNRNDLVKKGGRKDPGKKEKKDYFMRIS